MYISPEHLRIQPFALIHRPGTGALSNLVKGLGHINRSMHFPRYAPPLSLPMHVLQVTVVPGESIAVLKAFASLTGAG